MNLLNGKVIRDNGIWFDTENLKLKFPKDCDQRVEKYIDKDVIFGIRPEDIYEAGFAHDVKEKAVASLSVEVVEPMGNEIILYVTTGSDSLVARINAQSQPAVNQPIDLVFNMATSHLFDVTTEEAIR